MGAAEGLLRGTVHNRSPVCTPVSGVMVWGKCELCVNCERVAYLSAYPVCCIPGIHQTSIASSPSTLHTVCNEYATSIQYAGMQQYSVCNSMPHPSAVITLII